MNPHDLAVEVLKKYSSGACIGLIGNLGTGKTTFVRIFISLIQSRIKVTSPTFNYANEYLFLTPPVIHWDLYRLENGNVKHLEALGFFDSQIRCQDKKGFLFVEWPDRMGGDKQRQKILNLDFEISFSLEESPQIDCKQK